jgi:primosomal protein N' (replication factor Y)
VSKFFRVALDTPLRRLFDYLPPASAEGAAVPEPGARVRVPFGRRRLVGVVMEIADTSDVALERLKPILEVLDAAAVLDGSALELTRWAAEYYHHPIGQVLASALPRLLRLGAGVVETEERWTVTDAGAAALAAGQPRRAAKQRALLALLLASGGSASVEVLTARLCRACRRRTVARQ